MGRVSGRRSRSYNIAGGSPYLLDENIQCIDERIVVAKQRLPETSILVRCFITKKAAYVIISANGGVTRA